MRTDADAFPPRRRWSSRTVTGSAAELHLLDDFADRTLVLRVPSSRAVVLGSAQDASDVDADRAAALGLEVARRRSGGGAVFVDPVDSIWIDAWIPRADPLWVDDVSTSMLWLGRAYAAVLADDVGAGSGIDVATGAFEAGEHGRSICFLSTAPGEVVVRNGALGTDRGGPATGKVVGISQRRDGSGIDVATGAFEAGEHGRSICFLSTAPGEVVVRNGALGTDRGGPATGKVVGISQRRDRRGARLQSVLYRRWDPRRWAVFGDAALARALGEVDVHPVDVEPADLIARLVAHLNAAG